MNCNICSAKSSTLFSKKVLFKYEIKYFQCCECGFIQTEQPYWLEESYSSDYDIIDVGQLWRNQLMSKMTSSFIEENLNWSGKFLDYGGGDGALVRLMRDKGYDFLRFDPLAENKFATFFDHDATKSDQFELVTCYEVAEHLEDPASTFEEISRYTDSILFSTILVPEDQSDLANWWYLATEHGQHISLYTEASLRILGTVLGMKYHRLDNDMHLFTKSPASISNSNSLESTDTWQRPSLLSQDFEYTKQMLKKKLSLE